MACWINVDLPTNTATYHAAPIPCVGPPEVTPFKGVQEMKRDGGWRLFETERAAGEWLSREYADRLVVVKCDQCY